MLERKLEADRGLTDPSHLRLTLRNSGVTDDSDTLSDVQEMRKQVVSEPFRHYPQARLRDAGRASLTDRPVFAYASAVVVRSTQKCGKDITSPDSAQAGMLDKARLRK